MAILTKYNNSNTFLLTKEKTAFAVFSQTEDKLVLYTLERNIKTKIELHSYFEVRWHLYIRYLITYCIFKGFHKKLDYLTIVSIRSFFVKNNFVSLSLF